MELELKHIAPYLPYRLKMVYQEFSNGEIPILQHEKNVTLVGIRCEDESIVKLKVSEFWDSEAIWQFKPLLKTLSKFGDSDDLRKVHEFIGIGKWCPLYDEYFDIWFKDLANIDKLILQAPQEIFNYFLANHYDVFSLIPQNLAIAEMPFILS